MGGGGNKYEKADGHRMNERTSRRTDPDSNICELAAKRVGHSTRWLLPRGGNRSIKAHRPQAPSHGGGTKRLNAETKYPKTVAKYSYVGRVHVSRTTSVVHHRGDNAN